MLPFVGVSYTLPDRQAAAQRTVNMYLQAMETVSKAGHILTAMPGLGPGTGGSGGALGLGPVPPFGSLAPAATISGFVWLDTDADGVQDGGELGIAGVTVTLLAPGGGTVATTTTDAGGAYSFSVEAGSYRISVDVAGYEVSPQDVGSNDAADSDTDAAGLSDLITVAEGGAASVDCGLYELASISGRVWIDNDADGQRETGEGNMYEATVTLKTAAGATVTSVLSQYDGTYSFTGLVPGAYKVAFTPLSGFDYIPTLQNIGSDATDSDIDGAGETATLTLTSGAALVNVDAGYMVEPEEIGAEAIIDFETPFVSLPALYGITVTYAGAYLAPFQLTTDTPETVPRVFVETPIVITVNDTSATVFNTLRFRYLGPVHVIVEGPNPLDDPISVRFDAKASNMVETYGPVTLGGGQFASGASWVPNRISKVTILANSLSVASSMGVGVDDIHMSYVPIT
jgi:hypothetical protein